MSNGLTQHESDFLTAMREASGQAVFPPVPFDEAAPNESCEAIHFAIGKPVTPKMLAALAPSHHVRPTKELGKCFEY